MKYSYLYLMLLIIWAKPLQANIDINEIKDNMYYEIVNTKKKYLSIKNNFRSPYINNTNNYSLYTNYLDSLRFLAGNLEINRQKLFLSIRDIDLSDDDIYFINELNNSSILLFNIINGFGRIYHTYLISMISSEYSLEQYSLDMRSLLRLEKNIPYLNDK